MNRPEELARTHLHASLLACVAWRFWLGALSNKGRRGQRNLEEIGVFIFLAREFRGFATRAPGSTKPPCYAGYTHARSPSRVARWKGWEL